MLVISLYTRSFLEAFLKTDIEEHKVRYDTFLCMKFVLCDAMAFIVQFRDVKATSLFSWWFVDKKTNTLRVADSSYLSAWHVFHGATRSLHNEFSHLTL